MNLNDPVVLVVAIVVAAVVLYGLWALFGRPR